VQLFHDGRSGKEWDPNDERKSETIAVHSVLRAFLNRVTRPKPAAISWICSRKRGFAQDVAIELP
jgi:hypothetical protein